MDNIIVDSFVLVGIECDASAEKAEQARKLVERALGKLSPPVHHASVSYQEGKAIYVALHQTDLARAESIVRDHVTMVSWSRPETLAPTEEAK